MENKNIIAFNRGVPPPESFPLKQLAECGQHVIMKEGHGVLQYGSAFGYEPLREWIAAHHSVSTDQVIVGQGSLQLLDHLARAWLAPGDMVFIEQPTYDRTLTIFQRAGLRVRGYNLVDGAVDLDAVEADLKRGIIPKLFYVIPDFQNPSGAQMPSGQRVRLVKLAKQYGFLLVEDGPYRQLRYEGEPLPKLQDLGPGQVAHMSSFSKLISPGMRVGYLVGPRELVNILGNFAQQTYISPSCLDQAIAAEFIQRGWMEDHLSVLKALYHPRLRTILYALEELFSSLASWIQPEGGFFVGLTLNETFNPPTAQQQQTAGILLSDNRGFFTSGGNHFIRMPFCALTPEEITRGIAALRNAIQE
jgi:DNA-binding transcriptional MocR family regulator